MPAAFSEVREQFDFVTSTCGQIGKKPGHPPRIESGAGFRLKALYVVRLVSGITSQIKARPVAATAASPVKAMLLPNLSLT
jgi:hypothetical protein